MLHYFYKFCFRNENLLSCVAEVISSPCWLTRFGFQIIKYSSLGRSEMVVCCWFVMRWNVFPSVSNHHSLVFIRVHFPENICHNSLNIMPEALKKVPEDVLYTSCTPFNQQFGLLYTWQFAILSYTNETQKFTQTLLCHVILFASQ